MDMADAIRRHLPLSRPRPGSYNSSMRGVWLLLLIFTLPAHAGMTVITLTDAAKVRLDVLSFFMVAYLVLGLAVKGLWNSLAKTFERMPRLTYRRALALLLLSGLFLYVILTMISGARELLTPGAWEKQGIGYRIRQGGESSETKEQRHARLEALRDALWRQAENHDGTPPLSPFSGEIPRERWRMAGGNYLGYARPERLGTDRSVIAYEPAAVGPRRYVLLNDGSIEDWAEGRLHSELKRRWEK
jgi:hypothetical protein